MGEMASNCTLKHKNRENKLQARVGRPCLEKSKQAISDRIVELKEAGIKYGTKGRLGTAAFIREIGLR